MFSPRIKRGVFVLEGLNAAATTIYFNYVFFFMRDQFGFTNLGNLTLCAISGAVYALSVWFAGKYSQRHGYFTALKLGFTVMGVAMLAGSALSAAPGNSIPAQTAVMIAWTLGMSFTWPSLEAITSEAEPRPRLQRLIGIYNVIWSTCGAVAYFIGGALYEHLGVQSIFLVPALTHIVQLVFARVLELASAETQRNSYLCHIGFTENANEQNRLSYDDETLGARPLAKLFLRMAWIANPFAYIAMNAIIPVIPKLAQRFDLGPMLAGFFCSTWLFARSVSFVVLWFWPGWHYDFKWLIGSYVAMAACFLAILLGQSLLSVFAAQLIFGFAVGLIYYSSLFYSMDVGETKGEHGGFHEAAIGAGIFTGPAVGAVSLKFFPSIPNLNAWAVGCLLVAGLCSLSLLRLRSLRPARSRLEQNSQSDQK